MIDFQKIGHTIPVMIAGYICLAAIYCVGYFNYIGQDWLQFLDAKSLISISLASLPYTLLGFVATVFTREMSPPATLSMDRVRKQIDAGGLFTQLRLIVYLMLVLVLSGIGPFAIIMFSRRVRPEFIFIVPAFALLTALSLNRAPLLWAKHADRDRIFYLGSGVAVVMLVFAFGVASAGSKFVGAPLDVVSIKGGGTICTRILMMSKDGVLISNKYDDSRVYIRGEAVDRISSGKSCIPQSSRSAQ